MGSFFSRPYLRLRVGRHILTLLTLSRPDDSVCQGQGNVVSIRGGIDHCYVRTFILLWPASFHIAFPPSSGK